MKQVENELIHVKRKYLEKIWETVASLPDSYIEKRIEEIRHIAIALGIDEMAFYEFTGGFHLEDKELNLDL